MGTEAQPSNIAHEALHGKDCICMCNSRLLERLLPSWWSPFYTLPIPESISSIKLFPLHALMSSVTLFWTHCIMHPTKLRADPCLYPIAQWQTNRRLSTNVWSWCGSYLLRNNYPCIHITSVILFHLRCNCVKLVFFPLRIWRNGVSEWLKNSQAPTKWQSQNLNPCLSHTPIPKPSSYPHYSWCWVDGSTRPDPVQVCL